MRNNFFLFHKNHASLRWIRMVTIKHWQNYHKYFCNLFHKHHARNKLGKIKHFSCLQLTNSLQTKSTCNELFTRDKLNVRKHKTDVIDHSRRNNILEDVEKPKPWMIRQSNKETNCSSKPNNGDNSNTNFGQFLTSTLQWNSYTKFSKMENSVIEHTIKRKNNIQNEKKYHFYFIDCNLEQCNGCQQNSMDWESNIIFCYRYHLK